ncbi:MAG: ankyrin repeat domain-containing protein [Saprospiraceae bacterium]
MNILTLITILNWVIIAILAVFVGSEMFFSSKNKNKGGDAVGQAYYKAYYQIATIALFVLLGLNLLPFDWAKYMALGLVILSVLFRKMEPIWLEMRRQKQIKARYKLEDAQPIFEDQARDQIARAIRDGDLEKFKKLLQTPVERLFEGGNLLSFAISQASHGQHRAAEKLECIRVLFEMGATMDSTKESDVPPHMAAASTGNVVLLRFLLEQGADANASQKNHFERPILFEAVGAYQEPEASVQVLLEFGADPNATAVFDDRQGPITPLLHSAILERWGVCATLLEKGADPDFKAADDTTFQKLFQAVEKNFSPDGYTSQEDFERLKKIF